MSLKYAFRLLLCFIIIIIGVACSNSLPAQPPLSPSNQPVDSREILAAEPTPIATILSIAPTQTPIVSVISTAVVPPTAEPTPTLSQRPELRATVWPPRHRLSCEENDGIWETGEILYDGDSFRGLWGDCNLPTTDGGKSCTSSTQCDGVCLPKEDLLIETDESISFENQMIGVCSDRHMVENDGFCLKIVDNNEIISHCGCP